MTPLFAIIILALAVAAVGVEYARLYLRYQHYKAIVKARVARITRDWSA